MRPAPQRYEDQVLKRVIKESWRGKLQGTQSTNGQAELLESHAIKMEQITDSYDYESFCMNNLIGNAKNMTALELKAYLSYIEKLALGYRHYEQRMGTNITDLLLIGLTIKARDLRSMRIYYDKLFGSLEKQIDRYVAQSARTAKSLRDDNELLYRKENSFITRIFGKGEIELLKQRVASKRKRITKLSRRVERTATVVHKAKHA